MFLYNKCIASHLPGLERVRIPVVWEGRCCSARPLCTSCVVWPTVALNTNRQFVSGGKLNVVTELLSPIIEGLTHPPVTPHGAPSDVLAFILLTLGQIVNKVPRTDDNHFKNTENIYRYKVIMLLSKIGQSPRLSVGIASRPFG